VRGGFPSRPALPSTASSPPVSPRPLPPTDGEVGRALTTPHSSSLSSPPSRPPDARSVVEQLIEGTLMPNPLPDLELRLVRPEEHAVGEVHSPSDVPNPPPAREEVQREAPERAPALDLDALAEKIYQTLQRRQQFERER